MGMATVPGENPVMRAARAVRRSRSVADDCFEHAGQPTPLRRAFGEAA